MILLILENVFQLLILTKSQLVNVCLEKYNVICNDSLNMVIFFRST